MATRSRIGIKFEDGSVLSAYHHWDGDPGWLGRVLKTHYYDKSKAFELISGGDMSCCWTTSRWDDSADGTYGPEYYSQRGENTPPQLDDDFQEYVYRANNCCSDYIYLFIDGEWNCWDLTGWDSDEPNAVPIPSEPVNF